MQKVALGGGRGPAAGKGSRSATHPLCLHQAAPPVVRDSRSCYLRIKVHSPTTKCHAAGGSLINYSDTMPRESGNECLRLTTKQSYTHPPSLAGLKVRGIKTGFRFCANPRPCKKRAGGLRTEARQKKQEEEETAGETGTARRDLKMCVRARAKKI
ncbi:unnamed protein product [Mesocestoides corti]|uniref:Uncharacterized protein n=1 Tax=Mesocestoides corti TaxID=53468 RepID=A0A0R3UIQ2_MESCO|nr:unnamed protein product [Mesocestoides corti]